MQPLEDRRGNAEADGTDRPATSGRRPRVVIVGAGFAGVSAAKRLRDAPVAVTLIDRRNHHLFQPLLYQVATAALSPADIAAPVRAMLRRQENAEVMLDEVIGIDAASRRLRTRDNAGLHYDYLILCTGSRYSYFGNDEWARFAPSLKSVEDATEIRRRILLAFERAETTSNEALRRRLLTFVLVGGGPTGVEMAGAVAELARATLARDFRRIAPASAHILLVEAGPRLLNGFPESHGRYAVQALERMGVEVRLDTAIEQIDEDGIVARGERLESATVVWCAGVRATPVGDWLGVPTERNGSVRVKPDLSVPDLENVFVLGDAASTLGADGRPLPGLAAVAVQQGDYVGRLIEARVSGRAAPGRFRYRNWGTMATIGRSAAVADFGWVQLKGHFAWLLWGLVHIYLLIGFRNRTAVFVSWMWSWLTYGRGARLITGPVTEADSPTEQEAASTDRPQPATPAPAETARE